MADRPGRPDSWSMRLLEQAMVASARLDGVVRRSASAWATATGAALAEALTEDELAAITVRLYDRSHTQPWADAGLRDWEQAWYADALPDAPATALVCAAGGGREVRALLEAGYAVDGFEPAESAYRQLETVAGARCRTFRASYGDLVGGATCLRPVLDARYDAVILGWGSLSHVMSPASREAIWATCDALCDGPLLGSFYVRERHRTGRAEALGRRVGAPIGRLRGVAPSNQVIRYAHWGGFSAPVSVAEVEATARRLGRTTAWGLRTDWPYVTLTKPSGKHAPKK